MSYVLELTFDTHTEAAIRNLWRRISDAGYPSSLDASAYRPHISLAVYDANFFDGETCFRRLADYAARIQPFTVRLSHVGLFTTLENVVFLGVSPTETLLARHREMLGVCQEQRRHLREYYAPGLWTPHVTLAFNLSASQASGILKMAWDIPLPISGRAQAVHLVNVTPVSARAICTCDFGA